MSKKKPESHKENNKVSKFLKDLWGFMWNSTSVYSLIFDLIVIFVLIKFIAYPVIGVAFQTSHPIVAVVSGSMEHHPDKYGICGVTDPIQLENYIENYTNWWEYCGYWYLKDNISKSEFKSFSISSGLNIGDIVFLHGMPAKDIKVGDIIVFNSQRLGEPIIHRVVKKSIINGSYFFQTKGDNNPASIANVEFNIPAKEIVGVAAFKIPYLGYVKVLSMDFVNYFKPKTIND